MEPTRESASRGLSVNIRPRTSDEVDPSFGSSFEKWLKREYALFTIDTRFTFQKRPIDVERNTIVPKSLDLLEDVEV